MNLATYKAENERWFTNSMGLPSGIVPVKRILCLKLDHIGDLLVADLALRLLRTFYSRAHITLVCAPWNLQLARKLNLADTVLAARLLHQVGAEQHNDKVAENARLSGIRELEAIAAAQEPFELAIDLRVDDDTRDLLKLFKARFYAGCGHTSRFPFLDFSIPPSDLPSNPGPTSFRLMPKDFVEGVGYAIKSYGLSFSQAMRSIQLAVHIEGARTPRECGTSPDDNRLLGIGLEQIDVSSTDLSESARFRRKYLFQTGSRDCEALGGGWARPEAWGTWTDSLQATISLVFDSASESDTYDIHMLFRAHTNEGNERLTARFVDVNTGTEWVRECIYPDAHHTVAMQVKGHSQGAYARSRPISLKAGFYKIRIDTFKPMVETGGEMIVHILGTQPARVITSKTISSKPFTSQRDAFELEILLTDANEAIQVEIRPASEQAGNGLHVVSVAALSSQAAPSKVPSAHMETRLAQLVLTTALTLSDAFTRERAASEDLLTTRNASEAENPDVAAMIAELRRFRASGSYLIGIGLGATKETKRWPFAYFIEFCRLILSRENIVIVLLGGPAEVEETKIVQRTLNSSRVLDFCGRASLSEFGLLLAELNMYVGYDTGTTHYAGRAGLRTVGIFAAVHSPREWGPVGRNASWITHYTECSPCYLARLEDCRFGHACMLDLLPADCWRHIAEIIDSEPAEPVEAAPVPPLPVAKVEKRTEPPREAAEARGDGNGAPLIGLDQLYVAGVDPEFMQILGEGWHTHESNGVWSTARAELHLHFAGSPEEDVELSIGCRVFYVPPDEPTVLSWSVKGATVAEWIFTDNTIQWQSLVLTAEVRRALAAAPMTLECSHTKSPVELGMSVDDRRLGLWIYEFTASLTNQGVEE